MTSVNEKFATTFAHVPTSGNDSTEECTTLTLYVKPFGTITQMKPVNFDAQGDAMPQKKLTNTPKNTKSAYTPKAVEFQGFCHILYGTSPEN